MQLLSACFLLANVLVAHAAPAQAGGVTQQHDFGRLLELILPWISASDLDRFIQQFITSDDSDRRSRRSLAIANASAPADRRSLNAVGAPPFEVVDTIKPAAYDGWLNTQQWRTFTSPIGTPGNRDAKDVILSYVTVRGSGSRGGVIVSQGFSEPVDKYGEIIRDLIDAGFSPVYAFDMRGHGRSTRLLDDPFKSYVEDFADFVADLRQFIDIASVEMAADGVGAKFLHCHSMGCAIAFNYLMDEYHAQRPNVFNAIAANAPLVKPYTDPFPYDVAVLIGQIMLALGLGESYPPTFGGTFEELYTPAEDPAKSSRQNIHRHRCAVRRDATYEAGHTGLCLGDVTAQFAHEFFGTFGNFEAFMSSEPLGKLSVPMLLQQAKNSENGEDGTVMNAPQDELCSKSFDACTLTRYPQSTHNIWFEKDSIRTPALEEAFAFYDAHSARVNVQNSLAPMCKWWEGWCAFMSCDCIWSCSHPAARC